MPLFPDARRTDWSRILELKKEDLEVARANLDNLDAAVRLAEETLEKKRAAWEEFKAGYDGFCSGYEERTADFRSRLLDIDRQLRDLAGHLDNLRRTRRTISAGIDELSNKLAGTITCPACGHEFLVAHPGFDIEAGYRELRLRQQQLSEISGSIENGEKQSEEVETRQNRIRAERRTLEDDRHGWEQRLSDHERSVRGAADNVESAERNRKRVHAEIAALQEEIDGIRRKVFDEVFGFIDERNAALDREKRKAGEDIRAAECAVETLLETVREVNEAATTDLTQSLRAAMKQEKQRSTQTAKRKFEVDGKVRALEVQRERFVQFKTYLANTKIEALGRVTNEFLAGIGSDIRVRFDGYTMLKSGKVREKISVSLLRDGVDCGSFGKFSAGEAARVNLATILAMQKLVNANCDDGKGLDLLVLDEILEGGGRGRAGLDVRGAERARRNRAGRLARQRGRGISPQTRNREGAWRVENRGMTPSRGSRSWPWTSPRTRDISRCTRPECGISPSRNGATATRCTGLSARCCWPTCAATASGRSWPRTCR